MNALQRGCCTGRRHCIREGEGDEVVLVAANREREGAAAVGTAANHERGHCGERRLCNGPEWTNRKGGGRCDDGQHCETRRRALQWSVTL
ncbi:hypothetical protein HN51_000170 [Arachis hypogaea]